MLDQQTSPFLLVPFVATHHENVARADNDGSLAARSKMVLLEFVLAAEAAFDIPLGSARDDGHGGVHAAPDRSFDVTRTQAR